METATLQVKHLNVLHVDDEKDIYILTRGMLEPAGVSLTWAGDLRAARKELAHQKFDLVLLDQVLPDGNGLSFIEEIWWSHPEVPIIVVSGRADEALAISSVRKGALNFVLKEELHRDLVPAMEKVLGSRDSWVYRRVETDRLTPWLEPYHPSSGDASKGSPDRFLARAETFYRTLLSSMNEGCLVVDIDGVVTFVNDAMEKLFGCDVDHALGGGLGEIFDEQTAKDLYDIRQTFNKSRSPEDFHLKGRIRQEGVAGEISAAAPVWISCRSIHDESGNYKACLMVLGDLRKRNKNETSANSYRR